MFWSVPMLLLVSWFMLVHRFRFLDKLYMLTSARSLSISSLRVPLWLLPARCTLLVSDMGFRPDTHFTGSSISYVASNCRPEFSCPYLCSSRNCSLCSCLISGDHVSGHKLSIASLRDIIHQVSNLMNPMALDFAVMHSTGPRCKIALSAAERIDEIVEKLTRWLLKSIVYRLLLLTSITIWNSWPNERNTSYS